MLIALTLAVVCLVAAAHSRTPLGRSVRRRLVEEPAAWLDRMSWRRALALLAFCVALAALGVATPFDFGLLASLDLATIDILLVAVLAGAWRPIVWAARKADSLIAAAGPTARAALKGVGRRGRRPKMRRPPRAASGADDEGAPWAVGYA